VKAKKASYRPGRWGTRTLASWAKKPSKANRVVTRTCTNATGTASSKLCKFMVYKSGKGQGPDQGIPQRRDHGQHRGHPQVRCRADVRPVTDLDPNLERQVALLRVPVLAQVGTGTRTLWDNGGLSGGHPDPSSPTVRRDPCKTHFPTS
jgi:hypothetical protein